MIFEFWLFELVKNTESLLVNQENESLNDGIGGLRGDSTIVVAIASHSNVAFLAPFDSPTEIKPLRNVELG